MIKSSLCDYTDAYILVKGTITIQDTSAAAANANNTNTKVTFQNCAPFTDCISEINTVQVDNDNDIDVVMSMYNLIKYRDNVSKISGSMWQYYRNEPYITAASAIEDFPGANRNSKLLK